METKPTILGAIAGDIIGSRFEGRYYSEKYYGQMLLSHEIIKGMRHEDFTDDSVMTIAIADWLLSGESEATNSLKKWGNAYPYAGYGGSFRKWLREEHPEPYNSCGNGSAMRASAAGWWTKSMEEALELAEKSAMPSHNHPEGVKGAQAVAAAIYLIRQGTDKESVRQKISEMFGYDLSRTCEDIRNEDGGMDKPAKFKVLCQNTVPEAIIAFMEGDSYLSCIGKAMETNGDTDTAACICGSIAAAYYGLPAEVEQFAMDILPDEMAEVVKQFDAAVAQRHAEG